MWQSRAREQTQTKGARGPFLVWLEQRFSRNHWTAVLNQPFPAKIAAVKNAYCAHAMHPNHRREVLAIRKKLSPYKEDGKKNRTGFPNTPSVGWSAAGDQLCYFSTSQSLGESTRPYCLQLGTGFTAISSLWIQCEKKHKKKNAKAFFTILAKGQSSLSQGGGGSYPLPPGKRAGRRFVLWSRMHFNRVSAKGTYASTGTSCDVTNAYITSTVADSSCSRYVLTLNIVALFTFHWPEGASFSLAR